MGHEEGLQGGGAGRRRQDRRRGQLAYHRRRQGQRDPGDGYETPLKAIAEQQQARGAKAGSATPDALGASPPIEQQVLLSERPVAAVERTALR